MKVDPFDVIAGAGHDTAAAVLAIPYEHEKGTVFISCGTWSLVGTESDEPVVTDEAFASGLTNEGCFDGKYRLLQNTTGMWIIQELQRDWRLQGEEVGFGEMVTLAEEVTDNQTWIHPNDPVFASPGEMETKIKEWCKVSGQKVPQTKGQIVRVVLESLALTYLETITQLEQLTKHEMTTVQMVGGGIQNKLLCQLTADFTGRTVITGPVEASALGNILSQMLTLGVISSRKEAQDIIKASEPVTRYESRAIENLEEIPKILSPELVKYLMEMGHGDELVLADANFPAHRIGQRVIRMDGHGVPVALEAILQVLPLDTYSSYQAGLMQVVPGDPTVPVIWDEYKRLLEESYPGAAIKEFERFEFYEQAKDAYLVIQTGESALYGNIILKKGVL